MFLQQTDFNRRDFSTRTHMETEPIIHLEVKGDGNYYPVGGETLTAFFEIRREDGKVIESNWNSKKPLIWKLGSGQVVRGFDMFARQLTTGDRAHCLLPPSLAYGSKGLPGFIKPNEKIVVDILVSDAFIVLKHFIFICFRLNKK